MVVIIKYKIMCDFRLKCVNGLPLRKVYEAFEIEAVKYAVDNNYTADASYQFGKSGENFRVTENSDTYIKVLRVKTNKYIEFYKVVKVDNDDATKVVHKVDDCTKVVHNDVKPVPVVSDGNNNNNDVTAKIMRLLLLPLLLRSVPLSLPLLLLLLTLIQSIILLTVVSLPWLLIC